MRSFAIVLLLLLAAAPPAFAQEAPATHDEAQRVIRAEAERWRYPLIDDDDDDDTVYPDIFGVIVTSGNAPRCETDYTITYPAFTREGKRHAQIVRNVRMLWSSSTRHAIVNGTIVTLTWRDHMTTFDWTLETETPERAQAFAAAADFLTDLCAGDDPKGGGIVK